MSTSHPSPPDNQPTSLPPPAENWYLVHAKPKQERKALENLERQGFVCYLPLFIREKVLRGKSRMVEEPLFSRYLFIRLDASGQGRSWSPIRSTLGVSALVRFGSHAAKVSDELVHFIQQQEARQREAPAHLFQSGDVVCAIQGPFQGISAIYSQPDAEGRSMILLELLSKPVVASIDTALLRKVEPV
jgi:transcriptional antiterminator RfaH